MVHALRGEEDGSYFNTLGLAFTPDGNSWRSPPKAIRKRFSSWIPNRARKCAGSILRLSSLATW